MHPCFQNGDYPADAENPYQTSVISHTLKIQSITPSNKKSVIASEPQVRVAISSLQQQNSGHGARAPGNDCPPRGPPPFIQLINRILLRNINNFLGGTENGN